MGQKTQAVYVRLTKAQRERLESLVERTSLSSTMSDHIRVAVEEYLERQGEAAQAAQAAPVTTH